MFQCRRASTSISHSYQKLIRVDAEVRIFENCFQTDLSIFAHLPSNKKTGAPQKLQLAQSYGGGCQKPVQTINSKAEHLNLNSFLFTDLVKPNHQVLSLPLPHLLLVHQEVFEAPQHTPAHVEVLVHRPCSPPQLRQLARLGSLTGRHSLNSFKPLFPSTSALSEAADKETRKTRKPCGQLSGCQATLEAENVFLLQKWKSGRADAQSEELWRGRDRQGTTAQAHQRPATVARRSTDPTLASTELRCLSPCPCVQKNRHTTR